MCNVDLHQDIVDDAVRNVRDNAVLLHQSVINAFDDAEFHDRYFQNEYDYSNECLEGKCVDGKEGDE